MRREFAALLCALLLVGAGCQGFDSIGTTDTESTPDEVVTLELNGTEMTERDDPETDRLGWENGYWHNETIAVNSTDGLNESEQSAVVSRSMARVEYIRGLEFNETVSVEVLSREQYQQNVSGSYGDTLETFDNAKFEALFLVGEDEDSISKQESNLNASVAGYYSSSREAIVLVSDSETPTISETTLGHELVHALQDQQFGLETDAKTRDARQGRNGLIEGDASYVDNRYAERCGDEWDCVTENGSDSGSGSSDRHPGIAFMSYFPYSDGAGFVSDVRDRNGWESVNDAYNDRPDGAREVITPSEYAEWEPRNVTLPDETDDNWERVRPSVDRDRPDYAVVGPSAIASTLAYTLLDDYNQSGVVDTTDVFNYDGTALNSTDPYNYDLPETRNWDGGRMQVYTDGSETGYVWRTVWSDADSASTFADAWGDVIEHWGGTETADGNWVIATDSPFSDAIGVHVDGETVTVVNAPTESQLSELHDA